MKEQINNLKAYATNYKYIVTRRINNELWFWGVWNDANTANKIAEELKNGVVIENE